MFDLSQIGLVIALAILGTCLGMLLPLLVRNFTPTGLGRGRYVGGLPIVLAISLPALVARQPIWPDATLIFFGTVTGAAIGLLRDFRVCRTRTALAALALTSLVTALLGAHAGSIPAGWGTVIGAVWPPLVVLSLRVSAVVFEMPFLLSLISGLTFLLFFPTQVSTPPWAVLFTFCMILPPLAALALWFLGGKRRLLGDSGWFALGSLLAGISLLGRSKTLLLFGLLVPAMATVFPVVAICLLILTSYLGNELYQVGPGERHTPWRWHLTRSDVLLYSALAGLSLNFVGLLLVVQAPWWAWMALLALLGATVAGFWRTFARPNPDLGTSVPDRPRIRILDTEVDVVTMEQVQARIATWLGRREGFFHLVTADSLAILRATRDPEFAWLVSKAALTVPDGAGLVWAADFLGMTIPERVPGVVLLQEVCRAAAGRGWRVGFLGARPGVAEKAGTTLAGRFPGLTVAGTWHGYFKTRTLEENRVIESLRQARPDILFVALGVPRQEQFIDRIRGEFAGRPVVAIGVGGSFDVISGEIPRAPVLMQRFALEWLYRVWREPSRLRRILQIPQFVILIMRAKWRSGRPGAPPAETLPPAHPDGRGKTSS